jgi:hypothetical protein
VRADVPVVPDADTARRWATDELADPAYHAGPSLLDRFLRWLGSLFDAAPDSIPLPPAAVVVTAVVLLLLVLAVSFWVAGPVRATRRAAGSVVVLGDDTRTADELRAAADAAAARGDWTDAVLERFRAVVRSLEERTVLTDSPGRTADEAADAAAARLPSATADLRRGARLFDDVCYGKASVDAGADAWMRTLDQQVAATRPVGLPAAAEAAR